MTFNLHLCGNQDRKASLWQLSWEGECQRIPKKYLVTDLLIFLSDRDSLWLIEETDKKYPKVEQVSERHHSVVCVKTRVTLCMLLMFSSRISLGYQLEIRKQG